MEDNVITLKSTPPEAELELWVDELCERIGATVREREQAADQFCWRLSINQRHWLLFYSEICDAIWLQALEEPQPAVQAKLAEHGYV
ncbi:MULTISPECIES: DUF3630 family protein [Idiomarina]|mgnify:FL=1|jgi:hypothetical protein|uniref:DUF3630 family protein n=1 Tax=Idiomarina abyssalis TaxID=86102 RepID=A0A8I1G5Z6_9GAMM|nr:MULTISPECIES: DUF3630 family protein [Idiomarina]MAB22667.1 hypothetical protein [Idiomarina sp.]MAL83719.1 hypothetical protein [Idiomarina sp.]MAO67122.1 hypothetical protein [Idiomarina sp.]MBE91500.1 hypothetical protein [Idiomarina sp.]MBF80244.1 hypothetical protein [Idiomarina sp.]|tara:strand:+ start:892 stop:1152 length:261 start_codon:yes stop_codon:yes gene_type:complete